MQHESLLCFFVEAVDYLRISYRAECRSHKGLSLAASEKCRAVRPWKDPDLACYRADLIEFQITPVLEDADAAQGRSRAYGKWSSKEDIGDIVGSAD